MTSVAVVGAHGRMGRLTCQIVEELEGFELHSRIGSQDALEQADGADVLVDFTVPAVSPAVVDFALSSRMRVLVGTSGWSRDRIAKIEARVTADPELGILFVPNFSVGSVLASSFAATAARFFDSIEIVEAHHAGKVDSPSGTAVRTAELIGAARAEIGPVEAPHVDQRARGQQVSSVPVHSVRMAGVSARQTVYFGGTGERLTLDHEAFGEDAYAAGIQLALAAVVERTGVTIGLDQLIDLGTR